MGTEDQKRDGTMPDGSLTKGGGMGSFRKFPELVRRREMGDEFAWVSNVGSEIYDNPGMLRMFELGEPRATAACTKEELIKMGMAGLYKPMARSPAGRADSLKVRRGCWQRRRWDKAGARYSDYPGYAGDGPSLLAVLTRSATAKGLLLLFEIPSAAVAAMIVRTKVM